MVEGGWASTASILTDGVAIFVPRMRLRGESELLGSALQRPNAAARNPYRARCGLIPPTQACDWH
jgi:hypothetical protein